jgi:hypothetical protein
MPALFLNFSITLLLIFLGVVGLLLFRFFIIFPRIACLHCSAKHRCPQAAAMGVPKLQLGIRSSQANLVALERGIFFPYL